MAHSETRCRSCRRPFQLVWENCPVCGQISLRGQRNLVLKWLAILVFLISIVSVGGVFLRHTGGL